jgi:hypothetical protein
MYTVAGAGLVVEGVYHCTIKVLICGLEAVVFVAEYTYKVLKWATLHGFMVIFVIVAGTSVTLHWIYSNIIKPLMNLGHLLWVNVLKTPFEYVQSATKVAFKNIFYRFQRCMRSIKIKYLQVRKRCLVDKGWATPIEIPVSYEDELRAKFEKIFKDQYLATTGNISAAVLPETSGDAVPVPVPVHAGGNTSAVLPEASGDAVPVDAVPVPVDAVPVHAVYCGVCCLTISPDTALASYFCGHVYCQQCLSKVRSCPMCRTTGTVIKLFM